MYSTKTRPTLKRGTSQQTTNNSIEKINKVEDINFDANNIKPRKKHERPKLKRQEKEQTKIVENNIIFEDVEENIEIPDPLVVDEEPLVVDEEPLVVDEEPLVVDEEPLVIDEEPLVVDEEPLVVDEEPLVVDEEPLSAQFVEQRQALKDTGVQELSRRQKRKLKKLNRTVQDKATRTTWRTLFFALLPVIGFAVTYYFYINDEPIEKILLSLSAAVGFLLFTGPFVLWGSISSLRRGTRRFIFSIVLGFYSGFLTVGLIVAVIGALFGYTLLFGEPIPYTDYRITLPGGIK